MRLPGAMLATLVLLSGCAGSSSDSHPNSPRSGGECGLDFLNQPAELVSKAQVAEVGQSAANLMLELTSVSREDARVTVRLNGRVALDVRTPALPAQCLNSPIDVHLFRVTGDSARVSVRTDQGQHRSSRVPLGRGPRWVVVQLQDGFPLGLRMYREE